MKEKDLKVLQKVLSKLNRVISDNYFFHRLAKVEDDLSEIITILTKFIDKMCAK